ncbi:riboflavin synthase domain-like protein [Marasmius fiardii PR-910]|nr:riboflavin synthase domain-like protein [Marasmius fiardii PR-910]
MWARAAHKSLTRKLATPRTLPYGPAAVIIALGVATSYYFFSPDASRGAPTLQNQVLSLNYFTKCTVTSNEISGPDTRLVTITIPAKSIPSTSSLHSIWSVFIKDDDIQVERPYTPLEGIDAEGRMHLWIKKYPRGEVGRWLHSKSVGDVIELRGPLQTWRWQPDTWDEVVMISGGTGITPFYQLFHSVISKLPATSSTRFTLLHSSKTHDELPPPAILEPLVSYAKEFSSNLRIRLFVDSSTSNVPDAHIGRIGKGDIERLLQKEDSRPNWLGRLLGRTETVDLRQRKILFLVCGPEPMISVIAGPYGRNLSQGPVGGVLAELGCRSDQVYKL